MNEILITDSLFVFKEHEDALRAAGFEINRIDKPNASDAELIEGLKTAVGYILGGVERIGNSVIQAAPNLRAIAFTGSGYEEFILCHEEATRRGIAIAAAKGANKEAVAEFALALVLTMLRGLPHLMSPGRMKFLTTPSAETTTIGILGYGRIGRRLADLCLPLGFNVIATPRSLESCAAGGPVAFVNKRELLQRANVISLHVSKQHGQHALNANDIKSMPSGAILVNAAFPEAVDQEALAARLRTGELRAAFDAPMSVDFADIPHGNLIQSNTQTAFNTTAANKRTSDWVTRAIIAMLNGKDDPLIVNPDFRKYKRWKS